MASLKKELAKRAEYQINQWKEQRCSKTLGEKKFGSIYPTKGKICGGTFKCEVIQVTPQGAFRVDRTCKSCGAKNDIYHHKSVTIEPAKRAGTKFQQDYKRQQAEKAN